MDVVEETKCDENLYNTAMRRSIDAQIKNPDQI